VNSILEVGYVARAHALSGELAVKLFEPDSKTLLDVQRIVLRKDGTEREVKIVSLRPAAKEVLVRGEGIKTREAAEALAGSTVLVFREDLSGLAEGEYFQGDLVGLTAVNERGEVLGVVEELWATGPVPNLVIRQGDSELIVPFAEEFVPEVRLGEGAVVVRPPDFLE
jgi:16S rRNA processing protein RimM